MLIVLPVALLLASLGAALLASTTSDANGARTSRRLAQAQQLAEAGALRAVAELEVARANGVEPRSTVGSEANPIVWGSGESWATISRMNDRLYSINSHATSGRMERRLLAVVEVAPPPIYSYSIFAGNTSGDPAYELGLGGTGTSADEIIGNVYSAGDVLIEGDASVTGSIRAQGTITGAIGTEGVTESLPDIAGMDYVNNNDYDVAALFATATPGAAPPGGTADQLPATNPAHIFRRNPSDRTARTSVTTKDDYYLEDPYETPGIDTAQNGASPSIITLSGDSGTDKVFYVDGNLWVDNEAEFSFQFRNDNGEPVRVTFVVMGNIIFTDNLYYQNPNSDAVAFVAFEDPAVPDSGNVLFGDPVGGTLEHMDAYMYAENNFVDYHLSGNGTRDVSLRGNMTAGNHVQIERDFIDESGNPAHSKLSIDFDDRISSGAISLPGLPGSDPASGLVIVRMWRHAGVANHQ